MLKMMQGNNFKKRPELTAPNAQNQFQQSFNIVDMSNIHGKHVHSFKTWWNLIRGIVISAKTASVPDIFEIIAHLSSLHLTSCDHVMIHVFFKNRMSLCNLVWLAEKPNHPDFIAFCAGSNASRRGGGRTQMLLQKSA